MKNTATAAPPETGFRDLVAAIVEQCDGDPTTELAPLLGDGDPNIVDGRAQLFPYRLLSDVSALLGWVDHLDDPVTYTVSDVAGGTRVTAAGTLRGIPVELIAITGRPVPGPRGPASVDALFDVAAQEMAAAAATRRAVTT